MRSTRGVLVLLFVLVSREVNSQHPPVVDTPGTPGTPESPVTPITKETPKTPETPVSPLTPETPRSPLTPRTPESPRTPETPSTPDTPENTELAFVLGPSGRMITFVPKFWLNPSLVPQVPNPKELASVPPVPDSYDIPVAPKPPKAPTPPKAPVRKRDIPYKGVARSRHFRHSQKEHISQKETKKQGVPGMMESGPNIGGGIPGLGPSMGDPNMAFNAGVTSMGEGGGATMEGMPGMPGVPVMPEGGGPGPMAMAGSPMGMSLPAGGMEMPNMAGPGGEEPNLMSKQFIEGGGGMGGGMPELAGMQGMGGMGGMGGMQGMQGMGGMGGMPSFGAMGGSMGGGMGGMPGMNNFASMNGVNTAMGGGLASMAAMEGMGGGMGGGGMITGAQELAGVEGPQRREKLSKVHRASSKRKQVRRHHKE